VKLLVQNDVPVKWARVGLLGLTFKEDVPDLRNSRVPDILRELQEFGIEALVHDPLADPEEAHAEYGIALAPLELFRELDAVVLAVPHASYREAFGERGPWHLLTRTGILLDVKSALSPVPPAAGQLYWSL
jgi:UDP-N-acetyl-D-galactosamine dehydrogenase